MINSNASGLPEKYVRMQANIVEVYHVCENTLRQLEQIYVKGDPKTEGLCLSIIALRAIIEKANHNCEPLTTPKEA